MDKVYNFTDNETISREASAWMIKLDGDEQLCDQELMELREWLNRSPAHREKLGRMVDMWGGMNVLTELSVPLGKLETQRKPKRISNLLWANTAIASVAIVVIAFAVTFSQGLIFNQPNNTNNSINGQYVTVVGQQRQIDLSDGSSVQLNTNSQVRVEYNEHYRDIYLQQGEAYFEVAKNKDKPFRVFVGNELIEALGTAFTVYLTKDRDLSVTVTEGRVALATLSGIDTETISQDSIQPTTSHQNYAQNLGTLDAGQSAIIKRNRTSKIEMAVIDHIEKIDQKELIRRLAWREGLLNFTGEPLEQVVQEISRYTTIVIQIDDPAVRVIKIGGQFEVGDTDMLFDTLEASFGLHVVRNGPNEAHILAVSD